VVSFNRSLETGGVGLGYREPEGWSSANAICKLDFMAWLPPDLRVSK
jgi:hypothetical protein